MLRLARGPRARLVVSALAAAAWTVVPAFAQSVASVETDKADYAPGETVTITGSGWQAGETVTLVLTEDPATHEERTLSAVADDAGRIFNAEFAPEEHDGGIAFTLTATGQASGLQAQTTFTDAVPPSVIAARDHEGQLKLGGVLDGYTDIGVITYSEGDAINFRFRLDGAPSTNGVLLVRFSGQGAGCRFFDPSFTLGAIQRVVGGLPTVNAVGAVLPDPGGQEWIQPLNVVFSAAGEATVNYTLRLSQTAAECPGSAQRTRLVAFSGNVTVVGDQDVPVPASQVVKVCPASCDDGNACTLDVCNSLTSFECAHPSLPAGFPCGDPTSTECNGADQCDGAGACSARLAPDGTLCGPAPDACENQDTCLAGSCQDAGFKPANTVCNAGSGDLCDPDETCTGDSAACPADRVADATATCRGAAGVCDVAETCTGAADQACPADALKPPTSVCRADSGLCDVADTCTGDSVDCPADAREPCAVVTSSGGCTFDLGDACGAAAPEFKLIFTPDAQNWVAYKLNASNPGQFSYNLYVEGTSSVRIQVPWPFVTQGATPVHVHRAAGVSTTDTCFTYPADGQPLALTIGIADWVSGKNDGGVVCPATGGNAGPPSAGNDHCTIEVPLPDGEGYYVTVHLDHGFKGRHLDVNPLDGAEDRYDRAASLDALVNTADDTGAVAVAQCRAHTFCHTLAGDDETCDAPLLDTVLNANDHKRIAGVFGRASALADGNGRPAHVRLVRPALNGQVVAEADTDADGYFTLAYKHTGKAEVYQVVLSGESGGLSADVLLKANGWSEVNFVYDGGWTVGPN